MPLYQVPTVSCWASHQPAGDLSLAKYWAGFPLESLRKASLSQALWQQWPRILCEGKEKKKELWLSGPLVLTKRRGRGWRGPKHSALRLRKKFKFEIPLRSKLNLQSISSFYIPKAGCSLGYGNFNLTGYGAEIAVSASVFLWSRLCLSLDGSAVSAHCSQTLIV